MSSNRGGGGGGGGGRRAGGAAGGGGGGQRNNRRNNNNFRNHNNRQQQGSSSSSSAAALDLDAPWRDTVVSNNTAVPTEVSKATTTGATAADTKASAETAATAAMLSSKDETELSTVDRHQQEENGNSERERRSDGNGAKKWDGDEKDQSLVEITSSSSSSPPAVNTTSDSNNSSSSNSSSSGGDTAIFNTADEGVGEEEGDDEESEVEVIGEVVKKKKRGSVEVVDLVEDSEEDEEEESQSSTIMDNSSIGGGRSSVHVEEISSEEEGDELDEVLGGGGGGGAHESVVNASLIVNLSTANISEVIEEEGGGSGGGRRSRLSGGDNNTESGGGRRVVVSNGGGGDDSSKRKDLLLNNTSSGGGSNSSGGLLGPDEDSEVVVDKRGDNPVTVFSKQPAESANQSPLPLSPRREVSPPVSSEDSEVEKLMSPTVNRNKQQLSEEDGLPATTTVLRAPNGVVVYLVGTAHFSHQSQVDVVNTIQLTQPTLVLLELCSSRRNILSLDEETVLKEVSEMNFQKVRLALSNSGTVQGTLHLLLLSMSAQLTRKLGMAPGGEFRAAMREARKIPGCVLLLGDRPFNITISRALAALSFFQKMKLAWQFLTCNEDITREEIEKCKEKDLLEKMLTEMTGEFPQVTQVFVNERDVYLAHSLYLAATSDAHRSNGGPIVGVVGMGHVPGIVRNWGKTTDEAVTKIIRIPETPLSTLVIRKTVKLCFLGLLGYGIFRVGQRVAGATGIDFFYGNSFVNAGIVRINECLINKSTTPPA